MHGKFAPSIFTENGVTLAALKKKMSMQAHFADVVVPVPIAKLFTYSIPAEIADNLTIGSRVVVQFGRKKSYSAIVFRMHDTPPEAYETKPILSVVDSLPIVNELQLKLWEWISQYYICSIGEVYNAALPAGLKLESESRLVYNADFVAEKQLPEHQEQILNFIDEKRTCTISEITQFCKGFNPLPQIKKLLDLEAVYISEELRTGYKPKTDTFFSLADEVCNDEIMSQWFDKLERAPKQLDTLMAFIQQAEGMSNLKKGRQLRRSEIAANPNISMTAIADLVKKGILVSTKMNVSRLSTSTTRLEKPHELSDVQQHALDEIEASFQSHDTTLLHGVTSSGKTEIYIHLIKRCIESDRQALYLLPEIALTAQITSRLRKHFGDELGIYHSKFSDNERVEVWNKLLTDCKYKVILGVRSSIFLPFSNLGLIIVDEEHENSYKQFDPAPRYNARDMAGVLARFHNAKVLLGSATPSLESYRNACEGKFGYVSLKTRHAGIELPQIIPVDMREARHKKLYISMFSMKLKDEIDRALRDKEQVILFQNRRGFSPYLECYRCAYIPKCINCDVSLTYHKSTNQLVCHYCSYTVAVPQVCPACGTPAMEAQGFGTERIEEETKAIFPSAKIVRMDLDTARSRKAYEQIIADFEAQKYDILIGTQMISKGLDFENVSTVGILNADNMLNMPDFRAYERCFQLIAQVSGRAGRHGRRGKVFLQTRSTENPVIQNVIANDYEKNVNEQMREREMYSYPPFTRLIYITLKHKDITKVLQAALAVAQQLRVFFGNRVLGPQEPAVGRIATYYLQRIMLKIDKRQRPEKIKLQMMQIVNTVLADQNFKGTVIQIDVDPY